MSRDPRCGRTPPPPRGATCLYHNRINGGVHSPIDPNRCKNRQRPRRLRGWRRAAERFAANAAREPSQCRLSAILKPRLLADSLGAALPRPPALLGTGRFHAPPRTTCSLPSHSVSHAVPLVGTP